MKLFFRAIISILCLGLMSCSHPSAQTSPRDGIIQEASFLKIYKYDGYTKVEVADPWNYGKLLDTYLLVSPEADIDTLPRGTIIRVPLHRAVVYSSVHTTGMEMLEASDAVAAVADGEYFSTLPNPDVVDIGASLSPSIEKLIAVAPDAILLSPYQNSGFGEVQSLGVPLVQMADYMETTPLGRLEWLKFLGLLFGQEQKADSAFEAISTRYKELRDKVAAAGEKSPKVITEQLNSGTWFVPGGNSYMAHMLRDAGADYPFSDNASTGSVPLSIEEVMTRAADADFWLIRTYGYEETRGNLLSASTLYRHLKPFAQDAIYGCNTAQTNIFDLMAFRPDSVLAEYVSIFHPSLSTSKPKFFKKI